MGSLEVHEEDHLQQVQESASYYYVEESDDNTFTLVNQQLTVLSEEDFREYMCSECEWVHAPQQEWQLYHNYKVLNLCYLVSGDEAEHTSQNQSLE